MLTDAQRRALELLEAHDGAMAWSDFYPVVHKATEKALERRGFAEFPYEGGYDIVARITPAGRKALEESNDRLPRLD
jgi:hypothetical protein